MGATYVPGLRKLFRLLFFFFLGITHVLGSIVQKRPSHRIPSIYPVQNNIQSFY